jgi:hypothetical protein
MSLLLERWTLGLPGAKPRSESENMRIFKIHRLLIDLGTRESPSSQFGPESQQTHHLSSEWSIWLCHPNRDTEVGGMIVWSRIDIPIWYSATSNKLNMTAECIGAGNRLHASP